MGFYKFPRYRISPQPQGGLLNMTRLHYISPSLLPSRSANSVHVMHQCNGLAQAGVNISLYAKRTQSDAGVLTSDLQQTYGVDTRNWQLITFHSELSQADTLRIALMAVGPILRTPRCEIVLSRNLHAAWLLATARRPILFETHQLEYGIRKYMQRWIMTRPWVRTILISNCLVDCLEEHHSIKLHDPLVLHDAAPAGIVRLMPKYRREGLAALLNFSTSDLTHWSRICGYFGHLYSGRGIEIIEAMAIARPACLFLVVGGNDSDVIARRINAPKNLKFMGHVSHQLAQKLQGTVDVLLMPYQRSVSIGIRGHDTARWMSPMKMFEYLAAGVPIISSDLPVLREILINEKNCMLVSPADVSSWINALDRIINNTEFAEYISSNAHFQYQREHTWNSRAEKIITAGRNL
jgi:glycosyltransferase involved in cell wall biosynthesis